MPFLKCLKISSGKEQSERTKRNGLRFSIYSPQTKVFFKAHYKGEWKNDRKHGKGMEVDRYSFRNSLSSFPILSFHFLFFLSFCRFIDLLFRCESEMVGCTKAIGFVVANMVMEYRVKFQRTVAFVKYTRVIG